jgi:dienelactone hydrolase
MSIRCPPVVLPLIAVFALTASSLSAAAAPRVNGPPFAVGLRVLRFVDHSRTIHGHTGTTRPRTLVTYIRYPAVGPSGHVDQVGAAPATGSGPFPLVVFGHGFAVTPAPYARLLRAWASAGYVVAAPVFPLENANAPGGPNEADLINQPGDMRFVISSLLVQTGLPTSALHGLIDPKEIGVAGHSDGAETALAVAYDRYFLDPRVRTAVILSGAKMPGAGGFVLGSSSPALLATQGSADTINPPRFTKAFFHAARRPKFLLTLIGAGHLPPYTVEQPQLRVVEDVTLAFLNRYLKQMALAPLLAAGNVRSVARLAALP